METGFLIPGNRETTRTSISLFASARTRTSRWMSVGLLATLVFSANAYAAAPTANAGGPQTVNEQTTVNLDGTGSVDDGVIVTYAWVQQSGPSVTLTPTSGNGSTQSFTAPVRLLSQGDATLVFQLTVTDDESLSNSATVSITVQPVNANPTANAGPDQNNAAEQSTVVLNGTGSSDSDGSIPGSGYAWTRTSGPGVTLNNANSAVASFTAPTISGGSPPINYTFELEVTDNEGATDTDTVNITVVAVNETPTANNQTVGTDEDVSVAITMTGSDPDGDSLTYTIVNGPSSGSLGTQTGPGGSNVTYTPNADANGQDSFTFRVNDGGSTNSSPATVTINVAPINDPPTVVSEIGNRTATEDMPFSMNVTPNFNDIDDTLTYSATGLPASLDPIGAGSGIINGVPTQLEAETGGGVYTVTVSASDGEAPAVSSTFTLTIIPDNDAPTADSQNVVTDEDVPVAITLTGGDVDGDPITFQIVTGPAGGTLSPIVGGALTYTPNPNFNGNDSFTFVTNDTFVNSALATVSITVNSINDLPVLVNPIDDQQAAEQSPFDFDVSTYFFDADGEDLDFVAVGLPPSGNIQFNGNTGVFSGTPLEEDTDIPVGNTGIYDIVVTATDGDGAMVSDTFRLVVGALTRANIGLGITAAPRPAMLLDEVQFDFSIRNAGPNDGGNIQLDGTFIGQNLSVSPLGATSCTVQAANNDSTDFSCTVGSLVNGAIFSLSFSVSSTDAGSITVAATAAGTSAIPIDPDLVDNEMQYSVGVAESFAVGPATILGGTQARSVATGDMNNDGATDVVVGTEVGQAAQVYISNGFRGYAPPITIGDNSAHNGVALADFNNDGFLDVVFANAGVPDTVYASNSAQSFSLMATLPGVTLSNDVAVGQLSGDNNWDIAFAVTGGNLVYLGDGAGGFNLSDTLGTSDSRDVAAGPVDGNGRHDLVFANVGDRSRLYTGSAGGDFNVRQTFNIGAASSVVIAELIGSGDGNALDVAFGRIPSGLGDIPDNIVYSNNGSGTLSQSRRLGSAPTHDILAGDVNRDGQNDLIFVNNTGAHQIWNRSGNDFVLWSEQMFEDGAMAGAMGDLGTIDLDVGDPGGIDLAMVGPTVAGAGVYLNDGFGNLGVGDAVPPDLAIRSENPFEVPAGQSFVDPGASALDNIDGDISNRVVVTGTVNSQVVGTYLLTYNVTDLAGNAAIPVERTVIISVAAGQGGGGGGTLGPMSVFVLLIILTVSMRRKRDTLVRIDQNRVR
jgi:hypothetical protein